jgi:hypothetical protein
MRNQLSREEAFSGKTLMRNDFFQYRATHQAARLLLLWVLGKPDDPVHPDGVARLIAEEAQAGDSPPPMPDDREARLDVAARALAQEIRTLRGLMPAAGGVGVPALEDRD